MMKSYSMHNIRFYRPRPESIYCMCLQSKTNKLALSRSDASIEIWNLNNTPFIERSISPSIENYSIEGLSWFKDRLFSVGLHGLLVEYDLLRLTICNKLMVTGEVAFCLDVKEQTSQIAVGTEQGYLNIFDITDDRIEYKKLLDKQDGRILCLKYDHTGDYIVSGGLDVIRIWDIKSGHVVHKLTTGRSEANRPTIIWCLSVTSDFTIMSGDSRGKLSFWDGKLGAHLESYQSHRADILSLCVSECESKLYCAGVDSTIINFVKIQMKGGEEKWVRSIHKKIHDHDVRSLVLKKDKLFCGGTDAYLSLSYDYPKTLIEYPPFLQNPCVTICRISRLIMLRYSKHAEIWCLSESDNRVRSGAMKPLTKEPKKLIVLKRLAKDHTGTNAIEGILFSTMSEDGKLIAYGTQLGLRVFQFVYNPDETPRLLKLKVKSDTISEIHIRGLFTPDNSQLICAVSGNDINVYGICSDSLYLSQKLRRMSTTITHLCISDDGNSLVACDYESNIVCWKRNELQWQFYCELPIYSCPPVALCLHPVEQYLLIVYADNHIIEYDMANKVFTSLCKELKQSLPQAWTTRFYAIRNIFYSLATNQIILHDDNSIIAIDLKMKVPEGRSIHVKKLKREDGTQKLHSFQTVRKYKHLVHLGLLSAVELVAVEVNPLTLLELLPPVLTRNKFGTK